MSALKQVKNQALPEGVKQAVAIVETVNGKGTISATGIVIMVKASKGEYGTEEAIKQATRLCNG